MAKVALVAPAATVTEAGTAAALALLLVSETSAPPTGAAMASVTVPVLPAPPVTVDGLSTRDARIGFTRMVAALEAPLELAVIVTTVPVVTRLVVMAKVALVAPAATVTEAGTAAALALLLVSETSAPPTGAGMASVTVPVLPAPPVTVDGLSTRDARIGFTRMVAALEAPLELAVIVTTVPVVTGLVVMAKVALVAPAATVTEAGTAAALALLLVSETSAPPTGAAMASVTVPVLPAPPVTVDGLSTRDARTGFNRMVAALEAPW